MSKKLSIKKQRAMNTPLARSRYGYARGKQYQAQQMAQIQKFFKK